MSIKNEQSHVENGANLGSTGQCNQGSIGSLPLTIKIAQDPHHHACPIEHVIQLHDILDLVSCQGMSPLTSPIPFSLPILLFFLPVHLLPCIPTTIWTLKIHYTCTFFNKAILTTKISFGYPSCSPSQSH